MLGGWETGGPVNNSIYTYGPGSQKNRLFDRSTSPTIPSTIGASASASAIRKARIRSRRRPSINSTTPNLRGVSVFAEGDVGQNNYRAAIAGVRFYFGENEDLYSPASRGRSADLSDGGFSPTLATEQADLAPASWRTDGRNGRDRSNRLNRSDGFDGGNRRDRVDRSDRFDRGYRRDRFDWSYGRRRSDGRHRSDGLDRGYRNDGRHRGHGPDRGHRLNRSDGLDRGYRNDGRHRGHGPDRGHRRNRSDGPDRGYRNDGRHRGHGFHWGYRRNRSHGFDGRRPGN